MHYQTLIGFNISFWACREERSKKKWHKYLELNFTVSINYLMHRVLYEWKGTPDIKGWEFGSVAVYISYMPQIQPSAVQNMQIHTHNQTPKKQH